MSDDRTIESPPAGASGWREVWEKRLSYPQPKGAILGRLRKIVRRALAPELDRQADFNLTLLELLDGLRSDLYSIRDDLANDIRALDERREERLTVGVQRNDALVTVLDQKIEGALARIRDLATPVLASADVSTFRDDYVYRRFEDAARGSTDEVRASMEDLVDLLRDHAPVLDVGCGRGELLELCRDEKIEARGIDVNERSVAELEQRGLDVAIGAIPGALEAIAPETFGTIYASHVVEHLHTSPLIALMTESWRILRDGGLLVIETPNAESLMTSGSEFWKDPSHVAPRHPAALVIIARELGFEVTDSKTLHPFNEAARLKLSGDHSEDLQELVDRLNEILFADQDLRLILRKSR